jgi:hypothetical protein
MTLCFQRAHSRIGGSGARHADGSRSPQGRSRSVSHHDQLLRTRIFPAARVEGVINRYPHRWLYGTDCVAPRSLEALTDAFHKYDPLWQSLTPEVSRLVRLENYDRLFDEAKKNTRACGARISASPRRTGGTARSSRERRPRSRRIRRSNFYSGLVGTAFRAVRRRGDDNELIPAGAPAPE